MANQMKNLQMDVKVEQKKIYTVWKKGYWKI